MDSNQNRWGGTDEEDPWSQLLRNPRVENGRIYIDFVAVELDSVRGYFVSFWVNAYACADAFGGGLSSGWEPDRTVTAPQVSAYGWECKAEVEILIGGR